MGIESENFFEDVYNHLDAIKSDVELPFYLSGYPTNAAVLGLLSPADRFLHSIAIEVRQGLPLHLRISPIDPFFQDRIITAVESILDDGIQKEVWAF